MDVRRKKAFFGCITSDISYKIALHLLSKGWDVEGTYRVKNRKTTYLTKNKVQLYKLDFSNKNDFEEIRKNSKISEGWDFMMISPSTFGSIGRFDKTRWDLWENSFLLNSISIFKLIHILLTRRNNESKSTLWLWSGPGTNNAPKEISALITAKIAQIKFIEIINEEFDNLIPIIVGPGWVKTKAHEEIIKKGPEAGYKYHETIDRVKSGNFTSIKKILDFLDWTLLQDKESIGGRNFSICSDIWGEESLTDYLKKDKNAYKLRRYMNDWREGDQSYSSFKSK